MPTTISTARGAIEYLLTEPVFDDSNDASRNEKKRVLRLAADGLETIVREAIDFDISDPPISSRPYNSQLATIARMCQLIKGRYKEGSTTRASLLTLTDHIKCTWGGVMCDVTTYVSSDTPC